MDALSPMERHHLKLVKLTLCCFVGALAVGVYLHIVMHIGGMFPFVGCLGGVAWYMSTPPREERKAFWIFMGVGLLEGASVVGPFIQRVIDVNPSLLVWAFGMTAMIVVWAFISTDRLCWVGRL